MCTTVRQMGQWQGDGAPLLLGFFCWIFQRHSGLKKQVRLFFRVLCVFSKKTV